MLLVLKLQKVTKVTPETPVIKTLFMLWVMFQFMLWFIVILPWSVCLLAKVGHDTKFEVTFKKDYDFEITSNFTNGFILT